MTQRQQYAVVPREPTQNMLDSVASTMDDDMNGAAQTDAAIRMDWNSMLDAAPLPPEQVLSGEEIETIARDFYADGSCDEDLIRFAQTVQRAVLKQLGAKNV